MTYLPIRQDIVGLVAAFTQRGDVKKGEAMDCDEGTKRRRRIAYPRVEIRQEFDEGEPSDGRRAHRDMETKHSFAQVTGRLWGDGNGVLDSSGGYGMDSLA